MGYVNNTSVEANKHPYLKRSFWMNERNHFWENDTYTEEGKALCRKRMLQIKKKTRHVKAENIFTKTDGENPRNLNS